MPGMDLARGMGSGWGINAWARGLAAALLLWCANAGAGTFYWHRDAATAGRFTSSLNWASNQDGTGSRPPSGKDDYFDDAVVAPWIPFDSIRDGESRADCSVNPGKLTLAGRGADYWTDAYGTASQFSGVFREDIRGDFDVTVKIESQAWPHPWTKAGIIAMNDQAKPGDGGVAYVAVSPSTGVGFYSDTGGTVGTVDAYWATAEGAPSGAFPLWLRLAKSAGTFKAFYRKSAASAWIQVGAAAVPQGPLRDSRLGLFNISHDPTQTSTAVFDDFQGGGLLGNQPIDLSLMGTGSGHDGNAVLDADWAVKSVDFGNYPGAFSFGGKTLSLAGGAAFSSTMSVAADSGKLVFTGSGEDVLVPPRPDQSLPEVVKSGTGVLTLAGNLKAAKYIQTAGSMDLGSRDLDLSKELQVLGGTLPFLNLGGRTLAVAGNAIIQGPGAAVMKLNPTAPWVLKATGTISAKQALIANCTAAGSVGIAESTASDGGNNKNWSFTEPCALSISPDTSVDEGQSARLGAANACGGQFSWVQVSGPNVRILDPEVAFLEFASPRIVGDTVLVFRVNWTSGASALWAETRLSVREAIPDPDFTLPQGWTWDGRSALVLKPAISNAAALKKGPPLDYAWSLAGFEAGMEAKADSLVLTEPDRAGPMEVRLCLSNGGAAKCAVSKGSITLATVSLSGSDGGPRGGILLADARMIWARECRASVLTMDGRVLWSRHGTRGAAIDLPLPLLQALARRNARITTYPQE